MSNERSLITSFRRILFWFSLISGIASIAGIPLALVMWGRSPGDWIKDTRDLAVLLMLVLALLAFAVYVTYLSLRIKVVTEDSKQSLAELKRSRKLFEDQQCEIASARSRYRLEHLRRYDLMMQRIAHSCYAHKEEPGVLFGKLCSSVLQDTKLLFLTLFRSKGFNMDEDVSVSFKLVVRRADLAALVPAINFESLERIPETEKDVLITYARDEDTLRRTFPPREVQRRCYSIRANTAFSSLCASRDRDLLFFCNDLKNLPGYHNENEGWESQYNATIAVPVHFRPDPDAKPSIFGFLCVDSKNPNKYELYSKDETYHIASHSAAILALLYRGVDLYRAWWSAGDKEVETQERLNNLAS